MNELDQYSLKLNPNSRYLPATHGLDFCGYHIYPHHKRLRNRSKRKLCQIIDDFEQDINSEEQFLHRVNAWLGHAMHANAYNYTVYKLGIYSNKFDSLNQKTAPESRSHRPTKKRLSNWYIYSLCKTHSRKGRDKPYWYYILPISTTSSFLLYS